MSRYIFKHVLGNVEISNPQGVVLYRWTVEGNYSRAFTLHLLHKLIGERATTRILQGHTHEEEIPDQKFGVYKPPEYHLLTHRTSLWAATKNFFKKEKHHART